MTDPHALDLMDIGGTPGVDAPWPCQLFNHRLCRNVYFDARMGGTTYHTCSKEPYAKRGRMAEQRIVLATRAAIQAEKEKQVEVK